MHNMYVARTTQTYTDTLLAIGLGMVLHTIPTRDGTQRTVTIDGHGRFEYRLTTQDIDEDCLHRIRYSTMLRPLVEPGDGWEFDGIHYQLEWQPEAKEHQSTCYQVIKLLGAKANYNDIASHWIKLSRDKQRANIRFLCHAFSTPLTSEAELVRGYQELAKNHYLPINSFGVQVINPGMSEGVHDQMNNIWIMEWLKYIGFITSARCIVTEDDDIAIHVPDPIQCDFDDFCRFAEQWQCAMPYRHPIKADIYAVLSVTTLIPSFPTLKIEYLNKAFYKNMGNTHVALSQCLYRVPEWPQELAVHHLHVVRSIWSGDRMRPDGQEESALLTLYRDFLSTQDASRFIHFQEEYAAYSFRKPKEYRARLGVADLNMTLSHCR